MLMIVLYLHANHGHYQIRNVAVSYNTLNSDPTKHIGTEIEKTWEHMLEPYHSTHDS